MNYYNELNNHTNQLNQINTNMINITNHISNLPPCFNTNIGNALPEDIIENKIAIVNGQYVIGIKDNLENIITEQEIKINNLYSQINNFYNLYNDITTEPYIIVNNNTKFAYSSYIDFNRLKLQDGLSSIDISNMFYNSKVSDIDLSNLFRIVTITNLSHTFEIAYSLKNLNLSSLNLDYDINMTYAFTGCRNLLDLDIDINLYKIKNMSYTFASCYNLQNLKFSNYNLNTDISRAFYLCYNLDSTFLKYLNFENRIANGYQAFAESFKTSDYILIQNIKPRLLANLNYFDMFTNIGSANSTVEFKNINFYNFEGVNNNLYNISLFEFFNPGANLTLDNIYLPNSNNQFVNVKNFIKMGTFGKYLNIYNSYLNSIENGLFKINYSTNLTEVNIINSIINTSIENLFVNDIKLTTVNFSTSRIYPSGNGLDGLFSNCENLSNIINLNILFNNGYIGRLVNSFRNCKNLTNLDLNIKYYYNGSYNNINLWEMASTFENCVNLTYINIDSNWDPTNLSKTFYNCSNLINITNFSVNWTKVYNASEAFYNCSNLNFIKDLTINNTRCNNLINCFRNCKNIENVYINNIGNNISKMNMTNMFNNSGIINLTISNLVTSKGIIFNDAFSFTNIDTFIFSDTNLNISSSYFNTSFRSSNINTAIISNINNNIMLNNIFNQSKIKNLVLENIKNITGIYDWLNKCNSLTDITLSNIQNINSYHTFAVPKAFSSLPNLKNVHTINTPVKIYNGNGLFMYDYNLKEINCSDWQFVSGINITNMFRGCNNLSDASINNIINMVLNITTLSISYKNIRNTNSYSLFYGSNISNTRYQSRWSELTAAGWTY